MSHSVKPPSLPSKHILILIIFASQVSAQSTHVYTSLAGDGPTLWPSWWVLVPAFLFFGLLVYIINRYVSVKRSSSIPENEVNGANITERKRTEERRLFRFCRKDYNI